MSDGRQRRGAIPRPPGPLQEVRPRFELARPGGEAASATSGDASAWKGSSPVRQSASPSDLPEQFGRYRIMRPLGQGGMGAVYLAIDTRLDRQVALKVPFFHPAEGPQAVQRFECEALRRGDPAPPQPVPGLRRRRGRRRPLPDHALHRGQAPLRGDALGPFHHRGPGGGRGPEARRGAREAHEKGIIHRDLKPGNIMVNRRRELVIMDFGLARIVGGEEALTRTGNVLGTALYMAPEQAAGDLSSIGPACDVYSLGVILYELLTGSRPFEGPWSLVIGLKNVKDPDPPSTHRPARAPPWMRSARRRSPGTQRTGMRR